MDDDISFLLYARRQVCPSVSGNRQGGGTLTASEMARLAGLLSIKGQRVTRSELCDLILKEVFDFKSVQVQEYALAEINRIRLIQQQIEQVLKGPKAGAVLGADDVYIILTRVTNDLQTAKEIIKRNLAQ